MCIWKLIQSSKLMGMSSSHPALALCEDSEMRPCVSQMQMALFVDQMVFFFFVSYIGEFIILQVCNIHFLS